MTTDQAAELVRLMHIVNYQLIVITAVMTAMLTLMFGRRR